MCVTRPRAEAGRVINANVATQSPLVGVRRPPREGLSGPSFAPGATPVTASGTPMGAVSPLAGIVATTGGGPPPWNWAGFPPGRPSMTQPDGSPWPLDGSDPNGSPPPAQPTGRTPGRTPRITDRDRGSRDAGRDRR